MQRHVFIISWKTAACFLKYRGFRAASTSHTANQLVLTRAMNTVAVLSLPDSIISATHGLPFVLEFSCKPGMSIRQSLRHDCCQEFVRYQGQNLRLCSTGSAASVAAGRLSYAFGLKGAAASIDTACSSSLVAVHFSAREIAAGGAERAVAAGVNLTLSAAKTLAFEVTGMSRPDAMLS